MVEEKRSASIWIILGFVLRRLLFDSINGKSESWNMPLMNSARQSLTCVCSKAIAPFLNPPQSSGNPSKVSNPRNKEPGFVFFFIHQKKELPEATPNSR